MNQLVFIENGRAVTDSLTVAEVFGKEHKHVIRDIEVQLDKLCEAGESKWGVSNFGLTQYQHPQNQQWYPKYELTEDAFAIVAMSYVTPEAMRMKVKFLSEFKRMREQINKAPALTERQALIQSLKLTAELAENMDSIKETTQQHESKLQLLEQKVDEQITLEQGEQRRVQNAIASRIYGLEDSAEVRSQLFRELYRELKNRWGVSSYRDLLRKDLLDALAYINAWVPRKA